LNRIWAELFGRGLVDPVDDFRESNPPVNEPLLEWLAQDFVANGFDQKKTISTILRSRLYQQSSKPNETNVADNRNFSRSYRRRLPAEVLLDAISDITNKPETFHGLPADAPAMHQWNHLLPSQFLDAFGRPDSSAAPPMVREVDSSVVQALHLMNSKDLQNKLSGENPWLDSLTKLSPEEAVKEIYLQLYSRFPSETETQTSSTHLENATEEKDKRVAIEDMVWSLLNTAEFVLNH
jgi:hypothetical protein